MRGIGEFVGIGRAKVYAPVTGLGLIIFPGKLDMKNPGRKNVDGTPILRMYSSTSALLSKWCT
jgi:hypothetical protein